MEAMEAETVVETQALAEVTVEAMEVETQVLAEVMVEVMGVETQALAEVLIPPLTIGIMVR